MGFTLDPSASVSRPRPHQQPKTNKTRALGAEPSSHTSALVHKNLPDHGSPSPTAKGMPPIPGDSGKFMPAISLPTVPRHLHNFYSHLPHCASCIFSCAEALGTRLQIHPWSIQHLVTVSIMFDKEQDEKYVHPINDRPMPPIHNLCRCVH